MKTLVLTDTMADALSEIAMFHKTTEKIMLDRIIYEEYKCTFEQDIDDEPEQDYQIQDLSSPDFEETINGHSIFHLDGKIYMVLNDEPKEISRDEYFTQLRLELDILERDRLLEDKQISQQERRESLNIVTSEELITEGMEIILEINDDDTYDGKFLTYGTFNLDNKAITDYLIVSKYRTKQNNINCYRPSMNQLNFLLGKRIFGSQKLYKEINRFRTRKYDDLQFLHFGSKSIALVGVDENENYKWCKILSLDSNDMYTKNQAYQSTQRSYDDIIEEESRQCNREYYPLNKMDEFPEVDEIKESLTV